MEISERRTGIDILGAVPWGTHLCQFYHTQEDLIDILVPYLKSGLDDNEFCMWITAEPLNEEEAKASLKKAVRNLDNYITKGQIEIIDYSDWYTKSGKFDADKVLQGWVEKEKRALERGFDGLRLTGNIIWLERQDWQDFKEYEAIVDSVINNYRMLAICSYSLDKCQMSDVLDVISNHQVALIRKEGKWQLIECAERKRVGEALEKSEEKYRTLVNNIKIGVFRSMPEPRGKFLEVNAAMERITGYSRDELLRMNVADLYVNPRERKQVLDEAASGKDRVAR